jgi:E3 ubiquitin-protein ligase UBR4
MATVRWRFMATLIVDMQTIKLASVKTDSKFSTTTQIVKLVGSYLISKIVVRITDIKRTKMVMKSKLS